MTTSKVKVVVNGYGVIGKRVADAVVLQDDMELIGIADIVSDWRIKAAVKKNYPIFASVDDAANTMQKSGIPIQGKLNEIWGQIDVIADCTPKGIGAKNMALYDKHGIKAIFQGGEKHELTGHSFVAKANYASALGRNSTRVVSCNTTSIVRTLGALKRAGLLKKARGVLVRRATDPWESDHSGIMNTVVPEKEIPSHQGPDAQKVDPDLDVVTIAMKATHTNSHLHVWSVELTRNASREEILAAFRKDSRIAFLHASDGLVALNSTIELMSDLGRSRGDMWEVGLWEDSLRVIGNELFYNYQVYNQAIVVPETIDAIRALSGIEKNGNKSIAKTNKAFGIVSDFFEKNTEIR